MVSCCVEGCEAKDVVYFRLPNSKTRCKKWMEIIKLSSKPTYNSVVCSDHFRPEDYGVVRGKVRLKAKVLPIPQNEIQKPKVQIVRNTRSKSAANKCDDGAEETVPNETNKPKEGVIFGNGDNGEDTELKHGGDDVNQKNDSVVNTGSLPSESAGGDCTEPKPNNGTADKEDIENILTHYYIKQNKEIAERQMEELMKGEPAGDCDGVDRGRDFDVVNLQRVKEPQPVIIEVSADRGSRESEARDCLMLLESVQVDLDPNDLMLSDREDDKKHSESISLLTSSDDDDVIIQEPRVDTVVVSDTTDDEDTARVKDEEDLPLVRLVSLRARPRNRAPNPFYRKNGLGLYQYYCLQCPYRATKKAEYQEHMNSHSTIILVCPKCEYSTSSKAQYTKHKRMHQEKRRYQCNLCDYKARHRMSLVYHLKCHESVGDKCSGLSCYKCGYVFKLKRYLMRHVRTCGAPKLACDQCPYRTRRSYDLKQHQARQH